MIREKGAVDVSCILSECRPRFIRFSWVAPRVGIAHAFGMTGIVAGLGKPLPSDNVGFGQTLSDLVRHCLTPAFYPVG